MSEKVYVIANFEINNPEEFRNYVKGFFGILKKHGGEFITFDDAPDKIEGKGLSGRVAMWTFNSKDEFDNWYNDEEYQKLSKDYRHPNSIMHNLSLIKSLG